MMRRVKRAPCRLTRGRTRRGPASARRPSRLGKSKSARRRAACIARLTCRQAVRRAAVATRALAARVNLYSVGADWPSHIFAPSALSTFGTRRDPSKRVLAMQ